MFRDCAAPPACAAAYPDLREAVYGLASKLNDAPATVQPAGDDGEPFTVVVNSDRLLSGAFPALLQHEPHPHRALRGAPDRVREHGTPSTRGVT